MGKKHPYPLKVESEVKVVQSCSALCDPMDYTVHGILQVRILEWVALPFSSGSSQPRDQTQGSNPGLPHCRWFICFPGGSAGKESTCSAGDLGLIFGLGRSPGEDYSYPLQCSGLEYSMD